MTTTWVEGAAGSLFDVDNLPYGVFSRAGEEPRVGVRIGDLVLDLAPVAAAEMLDVHHVFEERSLNALMAEGRRVRASVRAWLTGLLTDETERDLVEPHLVPLGEVTLHLPVEVADYVDFYASLDHASNVGRIFRPDAEAAAAQLAAPARSATTAAPAPSSPAAPPVVRPSGQRKAPDGRGADVRPEHPPRHRGRARLRGRHRLRARRAASPYADFADHVFGVVGLNDWSARDIQAWEYVPLGPFLGKSFATSISHWVTPIEALDAAWVDLPGQDPRPLPYLGPDVRARARHRRRGRAERRGRQPAAVPLDVLVAGADARPPDRQRRLAAHRRPLRLRHDQRPRARRSAARSSS